MSLETLLSAPEQQAPAVSLTLPPNTFSAKELRRILTVQLVIQLTGGVDNPEVFVEYARRVERYLEAGMVR